MLVNDINNFKYLSKERIQQSMKPLMKLFKVSFSDLHIIRNLINQWIMLKNTFCVEFVNWIWFIFWLGLWINKNFKMYNETIVDFIIVIIINYKINYKIP